MDTREQQAGGVPPAEMQEAERRVSERRIGNFLKAVREAPSTEEALLLAPGTGLSALSNLLGGEDLRKAQEVSEAIKEKWRPIVENIRGASDDESARAVLGELEKSVGGAGARAIFLELAKMNEEQE